MTQYWMVLLPVLFPVVMGVWLLLDRHMDGHSEKPLNLFVGITLVAEAVLAFWILTGWEEGASFTWFALTEKLPVYFKMDALGKLFVGMVQVIWLVAGLFSFYYMKGEGEKRRFYGFYLLSLGGLCGLGFAGNLVTFYLFYELVTLLTFPLVIQERTKEALLAGCKYLFYSLCGAYMVLFGFYFVNRYTNTLTFTVGGTLSPELMEGKEGLLLIAAFVMLLGFGVKAGMFPMHGWLTSAHPVAPAPASAVLSGVIVKCGVLGAFRVVYYVFGADFLRGTWVQKAWLVLILITILMGSAMAYREKVWKKRLAYSTVSQASYVLLGCALMTASAVEGALLHMVFHAVIKCGLFLCAGAMIRETGKMGVHDYRGIGKRRMPVEMCCYTLLALGLIGIPPMAGFLSKWYLAAGALDQGGILGWSGAIVLLVSAVLTAGYLLPVSIDAFFREENCVEVRGDSRVCDIIENRICGRAGQDSSVAELAGNGAEILTDSGAEGLAGGRQEKGAVPVAGKAKKAWFVPLRTIPIVLLAAGCILLGVFAGPLQALTETLAQTLTGLAGL